jgi:preprotein translocase subunit SecE
MQIIEKPKSLAGKIIKFFAEAKAETKKVVWPDRKYVIMATLVILAIVALLSLFLMVVDFAFSNLFLILDRLF